MKEIRFKKEDFALVMDAVRAARKLRWQDVAAEAGVSASSLSRIKQGKVPDVETLAKLIHWAGVDFNKFIGEDTGR
jgi:transcriptional regulator with XRE-family HTH domain